MLTLPLQVASPPIAPLPALGYFLVLTVVVLVLAWPGRGIIARLLRWRRQSDRIMLEDALKQLYHAEAAGRVPTVEGLAGSLESTRGTAVRLIERLSERGLARADHGSLALTPQGQSYALRMVRLHRLWERFLADRTGVAPAEWHEHAERQEHSLTEEQAQALSARMGHPRFDPHGDPIPTVTGELPVRNGQPLSALPEGSAVVITHLEDEPREAFEQLLDRGLTPGTQLRLLEVSPAQVRFRLDGREHTLPSVVADQISCEPLATGVELDERVHGQLSDLAPGQSARVVRLSAACQGPERRRLLDLGLVPGTVVKAEFTSPGGDPVAYRVRGALIALRRTQAELIQADVSAQPAG
jgi:DtxR family Mn-dependent transcriptional regulator